MRQRRQSQLAKPIPLVRRGTVKERGIMPRGAEAWPISAISRVVNGLAQIQLPSPAPTPSNADRIRMHSRMFLGLLLLLLLVGACRTQAHGAIPLNKARR